MSELSNYRAVGIFDLLSAPLTPIGSFNAEQFKMDFRPLFDKGSLFIAIDVSGLDFLYSDAFSAFSQARQELAEKQGVFAILTDNDMVVECLRKARLDSSILIFRHESDMMAFSMKEESLKHEKEKDGPVAEPAEDAPRAGTAKMTTIRRRVTGTFTKSFNAIRKDAKPLVGGLENPFNEERRGSGAWLWIVLGVLVAAGVVAYIFLR